MLLQMTEKIKLAYARGLLHGALIAGGLMFATAIITMWALTWMDSEPIGGEHLPVNGEGGCQSWVTVDRKEG